MTEGRVECLRCKAPRLIQRAPYCLVCGYGPYKVVVPTPADIDAITQEVLDAAEIVDVVIHDAAYAGVDREHPAAIRLKAACRNLSLARAGILGF
jgi:hypothetical protein